MKKNQYILPALAVALLLLRKKIASGASPVGKVRRNVFSEIERLQSLGVNMASDWGSLTEADKGQVKAALMRSSWKPSSRSIKSPEEQYYNSLRRQYLKLVNPAIGKVNYPHTTSVIRNSRGDVVLTYNDYDPERDMSEALDWFSDRYDTYARVAHAIASGVKFNWESKKNADGSRRLTGVKDALFGGSAQPGEKKYYRAILGKNYNYWIENAAEQFGIDNGSMDDYNAVCEAIRDFPSPKAAKEYILSQYYQSLDDGMPEYANEDIPF